MNRPHVLVVVPDPELLSRLLTPLDMAGYRVRKATTGTAALALLAEYHFDLVIADVGIPDVYALADDHRLVPAPRPPVLCLTPCESLDQLVPELGSRVEDYVTKPCRITEVMARARVLLRDTGPARPEGPMGHADLLLDDVVCRAWRGSRPLDLTPAEFRLLRYFLVNAEQVLTKDQLAWQLWGEARGDNAIERLISRLRQKVGPSLIQTRRGFGYSLSEL